MAQDDPQPGQIYLVVTPDLAPEALAALLDGSKAACLLIRSAGATPLPRERTKILVDLAQERGVAALIEDDADLAAALGCDGVHLNNPKIYKAARKRLGPEAIVGVGCGASRHEAMTAGEAGADYIAFGGLDPARAPDRELIAWWHALMTVPCVALGAKTAANLTALTEAGADFVAIGPELASELAED